MPIRICIAGATGWTGSLVAKSVLASDGRFTLTGAIARRQAGRDLGPVLGLPDTGVVLAADLDAATRTPADVLVDFTEPGSVKARTLAALRKGLRVVIGTSGLSAADFAEIGAAAEAAGLGVIAAGNFSLTAALAKRFALMAARHLPSWEIIDYAHAGKIDAPSGTARELAEQLAEVRTSRLERPIADTVGYKEARGASVAGTQVHSVRLPGYTLAFEALFGLPDERLTIRHDAGTGAQPYVGGTLLAAERVMGVKGLVRGLDTLLFDAD